MKPKIYIYKFYAIGNGGMECYTTYKAYLEDVIKKRNKDQLDCLIDDVLGGNYPQGIRSTHCKPVKPSKEIIEKIVSGLKTTISYLNTDLKENKLILKALKQNHKT